MAVPPIEVANEGEPELKGGRAPPGEPGGMARGQAKQPADLPTRRLQFEDADCRSIHNAKSAVAQK